MIPYNFIVTSHLLGTLGLSFYIFVSITIVGFQRNGLHFFKLLVTPRVPLPSLAKSCNSLIELYKFSQLQVMIFFNY